MKCILIALSATALTVAALPARAQQVPSDEAKRLDQAVEVVQRLTEIPEQAIPPQLLNQAYGVAVIPDVLKVGFVFGARHGRGVLVVRRPDGRWSNPAFISLNGGSVGWQIGGQSSDIILVFKSSQSVDGIMKGKFTLGADASVAAGPVGRLASAATDVRFKAEVYSYSRSRGLFAGVALEGAALTMDEDADRVFYGRQNITAADVLNGGELPTPPSAQRFINTLNTATSPPQPAAPDAPAGAAGAAGGQTQQPADDDGNGAAKTFALDGD